MSRGQEVLTEPLGNERYIAAHVWAANPNNSAQYMLTNVSVSPEMNDFNGTPFDFFTVSTCDKFSLRMLNDTDETNDPHPMLNNIDYPIKWQFFNADGTLYAEYIEPENLTLGIWEANYGNSTSYSSGITPDFQIMDPGTYSIKLLWQGSDGSWIPTINLFNIAFVHVLASDENVNYAINAPDNICINSPLCWSITPPVDQSRVISSNWPYLINPCATATTLGANNITVTFRKLCGNETITLTKPFNVVNYLDFTLQNSVCANQMVSVGNITMCNNVTATSYLWNWGDGTTSNTQYASHSYQNGGTYTVSLTVGSSFGTSTMSKTIVVTAIPTAPLLSGTFNTCHNPGTFTITNPEENTTYTWSATNQNTITGSNTSHQIEWTYGASFPTAPDHATITIAASHNGCNDTTSYKVWKCCNKGILIADTTLTGMPVPHDNLDYYINGTVVINNNVNVVSTGICFGPEAKIIVNAPYTFNINLSTVKGDCGYMWDGIYVNTPQSKVVISNSPQVSDAYNAINSTNGGNFEATNTIFRDNYIAVKATDYRPSSSVNHPGLLYGNTFKNQTKMIAPYLNQKAYTGIYTDNVYNFTVGNATHTANTFDNLLCGIQSYNSYLTVVKNTFQNIAKTPVCSPGEITDFAQLYCETAIHIAKKAVPIDPNATTPLLDPTATIGGTSSAEGNTFTNCDIALNSYLTRQTIRYNTVNSSQTGFKCRDLNYTSIISNNTFNSTKANIYLVSTTPSYRGITVENNTLNNVVMYGIQLFNCKSVGLLKTKILNNKISYAAPIANGKAIFASNCDAITIQGDTIASAALTSSGLRKHMRGISLQNCPNSIVKSNPISKMGTAIYLEGLETGIQFQCNNMTQNYYGFYITNGSYGATVIDNQITNSTMPNDNQWTNHPSPTSGIYPFRITGDASTLTSPIAPKYWYYRLGDIKYDPYMNIPNNPATSYILISQLASNSPSPCGSKGGENDNYTSDEDSVSTMEEVIPENSNLAVQMRYMYMSMLYSYNYEQFMNETTQAEEGLYANIPLIAKINQLSQNDSTINKAIELNNIFAPINDMEIHRKFVNDVYLSYVVKGETPSSNLIDELYTIANLTPSIGGEAVHIARAILNYEPTTQNKQDFDMLAKLSLNDDIQWYPNPATDILNIASVETFVSGCKIELFDITGRKVLSTTIGTESNIANISLKNVKQGLYLCVIKNGEEIISSSKISVIKQ